MLRNLLVIAVGLGLAAGAAIGQPAAGMNQMGMGRHPMLLSALKLTDQQKADIQKVWFGLRQKQIDIRAKIQHDRLDYEELASAEKPDQGALNAKIQDMAGLRVHLEQNKLDAWFSVNKLLSPDQQKIWKKVLQHPMMFERAGRMNMMRGRQGMMQRMDGMGRQGMMRGDFHGGWHRPMGQPPVPASPDSGSNN